MQISPSPYHSYPERNVYVLINNQIARDHFELVKKQLWNEARKTRPFIIVCLN